MLIYVLWIVVLLSLFASGVGSRALFAFTLSDRLVGQLQAGYAAQAAVAYASSILAQDQTPLTDGGQEPWADDPSLFRDRRVGPGQFALVAGAGPSGEARYGLVDEERFLNLSTAPVEVLQALAQTAGGLDAEDALAFAESVADWRDPDDEQRPSGAEAFRYRSQPEGYPCKNGPFESLEELLLVHGVTPALQRRLAPMLTVFGSGRLNLNTAPREALRALGLSHEGVAGLLAYRAGEDSEDLTDDDRQIPSLQSLSAELEPWVPAEDLARLQHLSDEQAIGVGSSTFRLSIEARGEDPAHGVRVHCVIDRAGTILAWAEE